MENLKKHRDIKFVTTEIRRNYLVPEPIIPGHLLTIEMKKKLLMNKPVCWGLSILDFKIIMIHIWKKYMYLKILMYELWYDYVRSNYGKKTGDIYEDIAEDVETRFDTLNYEFERPLPKGKSKKSNWFNERWIKLKNHEKICWMKSKNLYLLNRWW